MMKEKVNQYAEQLRTGPKEDRKCILKEFSEMLDRQVWYILRGWKVADVYLS